MSTPEDWYKSLPRLTRVYFSVAVGVTLLSTLGILQYHLLALDFNKVLYKFQIWRLLSCFIFFGGFSMNWIFQIYILVKYTRALEEEYFSGLSGLADMIFMLLFNASCMVVFAYFFGPIGFLGPCLVFSCLYVWSRKDPMRQVNFYGFAFKAWQFPFVLMGVGMLFGNSPLMDIVGILVGHLYHFLVDIVPRHYNRQSLLKTPQFVYSTVNTYIGGVAQPQQAFRRGRGYRM